MLDRLGKGIRGAPRDALIADLTPAGQRGAAFGLRQSLDSVGAFLGPLLAVALLLLFAGDLRRVLWCAVVPAVLAVGVLVIWVREPARTPATGVQRSDWQPLRGLPGSFWGVCALGALCTLARFSEAFLVMRAEGSGFALAFVPLVLLMLGLAHALVAYPAGLAADRLRPAVMLIPGFLVLALAEGVLAMARGPALILLGSALWGAHLGLTQGLLSKLVAGSASPELFGTAFGIFHLVTGSGLLAASLIAGLVWDQRGPAMTFAVGAALALCACLALAMTAAREGHPAERGRGAHQRANRA